jgi:hypothetical protein
MIRHAADSDKPYALAELKRKEYFEGVPGIIVELIKQNVPQSCTQNKTQNGPDEKILNDFI